MKALHVVLICLMILAVTSYTTTTFQPLIQQEKDLLLKEKPLLNVLLREKPGLIRLGDPIEDPIPNNC